MYILWYGWENKLLSIQDDNQTYKTYNECLHAIDELQNLKKPYLPDWWEITYVDVENIKIQHVTEGVFS